MGGRCCSKVVVAASGPAAKVQWDRLGVYLATGGEHNGRAGLQQLSLVVRLSLSDDNVLQHLILVESACVLLDLALICTERRKMKVEPGPQARVRAAE